MTIDLQEKIILITGASSGIGAETARQLARLGARVVLLARNEEKLQQVVTEITSTGGKANYYVCDTGEATQVHKVSQEIRKNIGVPDIIFNNAGAGKWRFIDESSYEDILNMIKAPVLSALFITKAFLPDMLERNSGQIINATSFAGVIPFSGATSYIATRVAIIGFHNALQHDLVNTNIKASLSYFATIDNSFWSNNPGSKERLPKTQSLIPIISVERAARAIVKGMIHRRTKIYTPIHLRVLEFFTWLSPPITKFLMILGGYKRKNNEMQKRI